MLIYENEQDQAHIFQDTYYGSSPIHQVTIMTLQAIRRCSDIATTL